jgi:hypothetical protein
LSVREVIDLYGKTGHFDVMAITDHILMKRDLLAPAGPMVSKRPAEFVDVWEAANRDDLFSVTSLKHYPYVANSDFHKPKRCIRGKPWCLREEMAGDCRSAQVQRLRRVDAVSQRLLGRLTAVGSPADARAGRTGT